MIRTVTSHLRKLPLLLLIVVPLIPTAGAASVTYTYDALHRLTGAMYDNGVAVSFSHDKAGNRLSKTASGPPFTVHEDGEDWTIMGWDVYDNDPAGASITNIYDAKRESRVIELSGSATANGYRKRNDDGSNWNAPNSIIEWSMAYDESYVVYIAAQTKNGFRYIYYTPSAEDRLGNGTYIHHGLGASSKDGTWQTIIRDLAYDLKEAQPGNELEAILGFLIRGSGRIDDIRTRSSLPPTLDSDGDTLTDVDEIEIYGSHPYKADSDSDGITDGDERIYWGSAWNDDVDGDGLINILDSDSDGDGIEDGVEVAQGTDPGDNGSYPTTIIYEDAEHGTTAGWDIYDHDPAGAFIDNVYDGERDSRVIEFTGSGTANGYRLRDGQYRNWNDTRYSILQWSMQYDENVVVYIAVQTTEGFRYLYYTPADHDRLGDATYIHHGLGASSKNGSWQTYIRDLEYDLKEAQPGNSIEAVEGFLIRGSGRVDYIMTRESLPADLDSDGDGIADVEEMTLYSDPSLPCRQRRRFFKRRR